MVDSTLKNASILIVDDQQANIDILKGLLILQGYINVKTLTDPRQVYDAFIGFKPDLILLDLVMPHLNGFQIMKQLRPLIPEDSYLPILVLTADVTAEAKRKALKDGAKDFLTKPFDLIEVDLRIKNLLKTRYLHMQLENQNKVLEEKVQERTFLLGKANKDLKKANEELQLLDDAKNEFLHIISHEIRTPLNGILGFTDILREELKCSEFAEDINSLGESANRLFNFSKIALLITELRTKTRSVKRQDVLFSFLMESAMEKLKNKIQSGKIEIICNSPPAITIPAEQELLQICFENILENAIKYSDEAGKITVNCSSVSGVIVCEFVDEGKGFSNDTFKNLFSLFNPGEQHIDKNTGLDLALVKHIMDAHKGNIKVQNNEAKGATVRLEFVE